MAPGNWFVFHRAECLLLCFTDTDQNENVSSSFLDVICERTSALLVNVYFMRFNTRNYSMRVSRFNCVDCDIFCYCDVWIKPSGLWRCTEYLRNVPGSTGTGVWKQKEEERSKYIRVKVNCKVCKCLSKMGGHRTGCVRCSIETHC